MQWPGLPAAGQEQQRPSGERQSVEARSAAERDIEVGHSASCGIVCKGGSNHSWRQDVRSVMNVNVSENITRSTLKSVCRILKIGNRSPLWLRKYDTQKLLKHVFLKSTTKYHPETPNNRGLPHTVGELEAVELRVRGG